MNEGPAAFAKLHKLATNADFVKTKIMKELCLNQAI